MSLELSDDDQQRIEWLLVDFEHGWQIGCLAEHAARLPSGSPIRLRALAELIKIDLERHWQIGRPVTAESYWFAYPELGTFETACAELIQAEMEVRRQFGQHVDIDDYCRRYPAQAPELRRLIALSNVVISDVEVSTKAPSPVVLYRASNDPQPGKGVDTNLLADRANATNATSAADVARNTSQLPRALGRYRLIKSLGQGGMGAVYLAHDTVYDRQVAVRIPRFAQQAGTEMLARFHHEIRAVAAIDHANICPVYDVGRADGIHYVAMAYIDGQPLSELVRSGAVKPAVQGQAVASPRGMETRQVATIIRTLALALQTAHEHNVTHGYLKPANIIIDQAGRLVIMDLGLGCILEGAGEEESRITQSDALLGSPAYMSPEQVRGEANAIEPATDIYALGVIMYELLTGRLPFRGGMTAVLAQILTHEPAAPHSIQSDLDSRIQSICLKAMSKRIGDRFKSMHELSLALDGWLAS